MKKVNCAGSGDHLDFGREINGGRRRTGEGPVMGNLRESRKRVRAVRRAPDGSSFQACDQCGASVAILLTDMHECGKKNKKRRIDGKPLTFDDQPRSAFCFFLESYTKNCDAKDWVEIGRAAFEIWANMSPKERHPFVKQAEFVNSAYLRSLLEEGRRIPKEEDEVDSAMVGMKSDLQRSGGDPPDHGQRIQFESFASESWDYSLSRSTTPR